jgi:flagellum-specific peptidoglycan hydrolase FlgJ
MISGAIVMTMLLPARAQARELLSDDQSVTATATIQPETRVQPTSRGGRVMSDMSTPDKFIDALAGPAQESERECGIPSAVTIAQAILESDWGRSGLSTVGQNYFGIKAASGPGPAGSITMDTTEVFGGLHTVIADRFRAYNSLEESVVDHGRFLAGNPRYADAFKTRDPKEFAKRIHRDGYATDPDYCGKLAGLIDKYRLDQYDLVLGAGR